MKILEEKQIPQFLEILQKKPAQRIVHFCDTPTPLIASLQMFCIEQENEYFLYCTEADFYQTALNTYGTVSNMHVKNFNLRRPRYIMQAIEYDYLIATIDFEQEDRDAFLDKCYPIIRTGGNIIIIIPRTTGYEALDLWRDLLTEHSYVSLNIIHDIFEAHDVIVAKRMHGWGD